MGSSLTVEEARMEYTNSIQKLKCSFGTFLKIALILSMLFLCFISKNILVYDELFMFVMLIWVFPFIAICGDNCVAVYRNKETLEKLQKPIDWNEVGAFGLISLICVVVGKDIYTNGFWKKD